MHNTSKSHQWIFSIALIVALLSYAGNSSDLVLQPYLTTEWVVSNDYSFSSFDSYIDFKYLPNPEYIKEFSTLDFDRFVCTYNNICDVKFKSQVRVFDNAQPKYTFIRWRLRLFHQTEDSHYIFIG